jgi:DHA1 family tetracycline resistance protein-like MFS transporter
MAAIGTRAPGRAAFAFIFVTVALDMMALGVMIPVLPKLVIEFERGDTASAAVMFGLFGTVWAGMQFLFMPLMGNLSDRFGRRPVVLLSNLGLGLDYLLMAVAPSLAWLFVGRVISGMVSASYATAGAYVADILPPEQRARHFGFLGAAFGIGFIIGPAFGGLLGVVDLRLPFWVAAGLSLLNAAYGYFILPESLPRERRAPFAWRKANPFGALVFLRSHPMLLALAAAAFLSRIAHDSLPSTYVLYVDYRYGWDEMSVGLSLAAVGICSMIVQAGLVGPSVASLGERRVLLAGLLFGALGFAIQALAPTGTLFLIGIPFIALYGLANPAMQALMSQRVGPEAQGQLQGTIHSLGGLAGLLAPFIFTQAFAAFIAPETPLQLPGAPWLLAAAFLIASAAIAARQTRPLG